VVHTVATLLLTANYRIKRHGPYYKTVIKTKKIDRHIGPSMSSICNEEDKRDDSAPGGTGMRLALNHLFASRRGKCLGECYLCGVTTHVSSAVVWLKKRKSSAGSVDGAVKPYEQRNDIIASPCNLSQWGF
jgi:hypothetical protein